MTSPLYVRFLHAFSCSWPSMLCPVCRSLESDPHCRLVENPTGRSGFMVAARMTGPIGQSMVAIQSESTVFGLAAISRMAEQSVFPHLRLQCLSGRAFGRDAPACRPCADTRAGPMNSSPGRNGGSQRGTAKRRTPVPARSVKNTRRQGCGSSRKLTGNSPPAKMARVKRARSTRQDTAPPSRA